MNLEMEINDMSDDLDKQLENIGNHTNINCYRVDDFRRNLTQSKENLNLY
jgi:hypothetical protein